MISPPGQIRFLCSAGGHSGLGHLRRCLTLAEQFHRLGSVIHFVISANDATAPLENEINAIGSCDTTPTIEDAVRQILNQPVPDLLVLDSYDLTVGQEGRLSDTGFPLLVIEDLPVREHKAALLMDPTVGRQRQDYEPFVSSKARAFLGPRYALLRPGFEQDPHRNETAGARKDRVLIAFGGTDPNNASQKILDALRDTPVQMDIVLGSVAPHLNQLRKAASERARLHVDVNASEFAALMRRANLCIGAGGGNAWERCAVGVPTLAYQIADNQRDVLKFLSDRDALIFGGDLNAVSSAMIQRQCLSLLEDPAVLHNMRTVGPSICDGQGAARLATYLSTCPLRDGSTLSLRPACPADRDRILDWQKAPGARDYARNAAIPSAEEHATWFSKRLNLDGFPFFIILVNDDPAGFLRLDPIETHEADFEIAILVDRKYAGRGVGVGALTLVSKAESRAVFQAEVDPRNIASKMIFERAGFVGISERQWRKPPHSEGGADNGKDRQI